ncbi:MAG TPA: XRE family transcriptional regulator [Flavobacteriaceae bacterium]|nr:XRE family transcriptional regulator [Flavobacteriaceae bacterium]
MSTDKLAIMDTVLSNKIKSGRKLRAFSQQKLADAIGVSKQMISKYENSVSVPSSGVMIKMAKSLGLSLDYFFTPPTVELGEINFRKKSKLSVKRLDAIKEEVKLKLSNYLEVENILKIDTIFDIAAQIRSLNASSDIEEVVRVIREDWQIGFDPVHNITQLLEDQKIKVIEIAEKENLFDGMAALIDDKYAVIVINENFSIERKRFTLLHELGHLILAVPNVDNKEEEKYCNHFAAEFLFPKADVLKEFGRKRNAISVEELIETQKKYGISIQAIIYRLLDANIISKSQQTSFYKQINFNKELKDQINKERFETPEYSHRYKQLVYRAYSQELISASKTANLLRKNINEIVAKEMV